MNTLPVYDERLVLIDPIWQAIILGILQGLTEFLPISSSAHLLLLPWFAEWTPLGILFDVVLHGGTLGAVLLYFRKDWEAFGWNLINRFSQAGTAAGKRLVDAILIGTMPAILIALLFRGYIEEYARKPIVTVVSLSVFGLLLLWADRRGRRERDCSSVSIRDGLLVGLGQAIALVPGVSRSGITITMALFLGFSRPEAARFSFLLAGPIIGLGAVNGFLELMLGATDEPLPLLLIVAGVVTSFAVGFLCIKYFLRFLESRTYLPFVVYRILLALLILFVYVQSAWW